MAVLFIWKKKHMNVVLSSENLHFLKRSYLLIWQRKRDSRRSSLLGGRSISSSNKVTLGGPWTVSEWGAWSPGRSSLEEKPGTYSAPLPPLGRGGGAGVELIIDYVFVIIDYTSFKSPKWQGSENFQVGKHTHGPRGWYPPPQDKSTHPWGPPRPPLWISFIHILYSKLAKVSTSFKINQQR